MLSHLLYDLRIVEFFYQVFIKNFQNVQYDCLLLCFWPTCILFYVPDRLLVMKLFSLIMFLTLNSFCLILTKESKFIILLMHMIYFPSVLFSSFDRLSLSLGDSWDLVLFISEDSYLHVDFYFIETSLNVMIYLVVFLVVLIFCLVYLVFTTYVIFCLQFLIVTGKDEKIKKIQS